MNFIEFIQLLLRNKKWVFIFPFVISLTILLLTRNMPHTYSSDMVIYTGIASGYNIDNDNGKIDFHEANSKFDNLINTITSKETRKEVALDFLSTMLHHPDHLKRIIVKMKLDHLEWLNNKATVAKVMGADEQTTFQNLMLQLQQGVQNPYYQVLYGRYGNPFNVNTLNTVKAARLGSSDMVKVEYQSQDAFVTKKTLDILSEVFLNKYKALRIGEVSNVVKYFEEQTAQSAARLQLAEEGLKNFKTNNRIINYYEQTKYIADQKEDYEQRESQLRMDLNGYQSALSRVEAKLNTRVLVQVKSEEVVKARNNLSEYYNSMGLALVKGEIKNENAAVKVEELKNHLKENVRGLYDLNNSTEGMPGKDMLDEWLKLTINVEESSSKLNVLENCISKFERVYDHFSPMGSDLSKLERNVDVAEKEYLILLHNLSQAKLRERNLAVTENISVTDPPDMPAVANSSKRLLLLIAGFMSCFILVLTCLVLKEYMDDSISNPMHFQKISGIKAATAFAQHTTLQTIRMEEMNALSNERWILSLIDLEQQNGNDSFTVLAVPFHKTDIDCKHMLRTVVAQMDTLGHKWSMREMNATQASNGRQLIFANTSNRELIHKDQLTACKMIYFFVDAEQKFDEYQKELVDNWRQLNIPIQAILVNTKIHQLEKFIGEIPKARSPFRKFIKTILKRYSK